MRGGRVSESPEHPLGAKVMDGSGLMELMVKDGKWGVMV